MDATLLLLWLVSLTLAVVGIGGWLWLLGMGAIMVKTGPAFIRGLGIVTLWVALIFAVGMAAAIQRQAALGPLSDVRTWWLPV